MKRVKTRDQRSNCKLIERREILSPRKLQKENFETNTGFNLLKPTGHVMHQRFNIQQFYVLPTLYLCVLYLSENKQRLVSLTA